MVQLLVLCILVCVVHQETAVLKYLTCLALPYSQGRKNERYIESHANGSTLKRLKRDWHPQ